MNILPIILIAGTGFIFLNKRKSSNLKSSELNGSNSLSKSLNIPKGYEIINCQTLNITEPVDAFEYAYKLGKAISAGKPKLPEDMLFAGMKNGQIVNCLTTKESYKTLLNTPEKANFAFEMFKFYYSGLSSPETEVSYMDNLLTIRNMFKNYGFDISKMKVEIIKE